MGLLDALRRTPDTSTDDLAASLRQEQNQSLHLVERITELELALEDVGWQQLSREGAREFSREGLDQISRLARLMWLKNPLIRRGVNLRATYTFGAATPEISSEDERVNALIAEVMANNAEELFDAPAALDTDVDMHLDGGVFLALFTEPTTGKVTARSMPAVEIRDIICDPDDYRSPQFYLRQWHVPKPNGLSETKHAWHPHHAYRPTTGRPTEIQGYEVRWDAPVMHWKAGGTKHMRFGVPEVYAALDWARAHKGFLEDWATLVKSLSRFAWRLTAKKGAGRKAKKLASTLGLDSPETNPSHAPGSAVGLPEGADLEAIPKTGATPSAGDNRELRLMVAAALDLPDTWLSGDVDVGNHATAASMDRPTELMLTARRKRYAAHYREFYDYCMRAAVKAPSGLLSGTVRVNEQGRETLDLGPTVSATIQVDWPPLVEHSTKDRIEAIVNAATLGGESQAGMIPTDALRRELLVTLGVENVDELLDGFDDADDGVTEGLAAAVVRLSEAVELADAA